MPASTILRSKPCNSNGPGVVWRSEEHTSELQSQSNLVCRLLLEKKKTLEIGIREVELEGPGCRVLVAALEPSELVRRGQRSVPVLRRAGLDDESRRSRAVDAGDR